MLHESTSTHVSFPLLFVFVPSSLTLIICISTKTFAIVQAPENCALIGIFRNMSFVGTSLICCHPLVPGSWKGRKWLTWYINGSFLFWFMGNYAHNYVASNTLKVFSFTSLLLSRNAKKPCILIVFLLSLSSHAIPCLWRSVVHDSKFWSFPEEIFLLRKQSLIQILDFFIASIGFLLSILLVCGNGWEYNILLRKIRSYFVPERSCGKKESCNRTPSNLLTSTLKISHSFGPVFCL